MRKEFTSWLERYAATNENVVLLTGDLGFQALEGVRNRIAARFVNMGVAEQNMVSVAAGLASEGLRPICYSIAPFTVFRPAEQIRLDVCIHGLDVKIVGNGGGYGYGIMGATHHALEDLAVLSSFPKMQCFIPVTGADVETTCDAMMSVKGPSYLRLNMGTLPEKFSIDRQFAPVRRVANTTASTTPALTVVGLGPAVLNTLGSPPESLEWFVVSQLPTPKFPDALFDSVKRTGKLLIVEEHTERGGLAEHLSLALLRRGLAPKLYTRAALGYPDGKYGSQQWHQRQSGLDAAALNTLVGDILHERA